jgi:PAS domain S-box-containing protein
VPNLHRIPAITPPQNGPRILWLVRCLTLTGLAMVVITISFAGHSLNAIREERFRLAGQEAENFRIIKELRARLAVHDLARRELEEIGQEHVPGSPVKEAMTNAAAREHADASAEQTEHHLISVWEQFVLTGAGCLSLFLWLAWLISRRIQHQVQALETARIDAEASHETAKKLMLEQQAAAARLTTAVRALQQSEQRFRSLSESAPIGIFETDTAGRYIYANPQWEKITGRSLQENIGASWREALHPDDQAELFQSWQGASAAGVKFDREVRLLLAGDEIRWAHLRTVAVHADSGEVTGYVGTVEDITLRKEIETEICFVHDAALESARLKSRFLANMSHEIRTPMNGVIGMTNLLLDTALTSEQRDYSETIRASAEGLLTVINDILDFSKIEAGKMAFEETDFDLQEALEGTLELLAETAQRKKIELAGLIEPGVPTLLRGDSGRIRQVLTNLIGNAIKFTHEGEVTIRISVAEASESLVDLRFCVNDTGIGISPDAQRRLFAPFTQADVSTTRKFGGTGLGLAICRQLIEKMGGQIGVKSAEGRGSTFWFNLPLDRQSLETSGTSGDHSLVGQRVLIVDDNPSNAGFLEEQITAWKMPALVAHSGAAGIDALREAERAGQKFALAIVDMEMPEMDGLALARQIKADPQISETRLILLTNFGRRISPQELRLAGIADCRPKPIRQSHLFDCLASVMAASSIDASPESRSSQEPIIRHEERVLIAEDNPVNQKVALGQLRKLGYRAEAVANGFEALQALGQIPYDIVLMDCHMPEMDGYEATAAIRQHEGPARHTWIVAMTANAIQGDRERCLAAGMDDYISKPVRLDELAEALDRAQQNIAKLEDDSVIDPTRIEELRLLAEGMGQEVLVDLTQLFFGQAPQLVSELFDAHSRSDLPGIAATAHFLKGSSGQFGARHLQYLCSEIEKAGRQQSLHQIPDLLDSIAREVQHVIDALKRALLSPNPHYV